MKKYWRIFKYALLAYSLTFVVLNWSSFSGLIHFAKTYINYEYVSSSPITLQSDYDEMFDLIKLNSNERISYLSSALDSLNLTYRLDSIGQNQANIFVAGNTSKPISIITAHHDILDRDNYEGALDNTGSVNILLNLCEKIDFKEKPIGILFTGLEERGLIGAKYFINKTAIDLNLEIKEVICLDGVGKGNLAVMNNGRKFGYKFRNLLFQKKLFSGKKFRASADYTPYPTHILDLKKDGIKELKSFVSSTDSKVFLEAGIPTLQLVSSNIYHFLSVLHTNNDKLETIDHSSLVQCEKILTNYVDELQK